MAKEFPFYSSYQFASNNSILAVDLEGLESSNIKNKTETKTSEQSESPDKKVDPKGVNQSTVGKNLFGSVYMGTEHNPTHNDGTDTFIPKGNDPVDEYGAKPHDKESGGIGARTGSNLVGDLKLGYKGIKYMALVAENYVVVPIAGVKPNSYQGKPLTISTTGVRALGVTTCAIYLVIAKSILIAVKDTPVSMYNSAADFVNEVKYKTEQGLNDIQNWTPKP